MLEILAALGIGGLLGGWFRGRHERTEAHRERMIQTAMPFFDATEAATASLTKAIRLVAANAADSSEEHQRRGREHLLAAEAATETADALIPRFGFVFPNLHEKEVWLLARDLTSALDRWREVLEDGLREGTYDKEKARDAALAAGYHAGYLAADIHNHVWRSRFSVWPGEQRARRTLHKVKGRLSRSDAKEPAEREREGRAIEDE